LNAVHARHLYTHTPVPVRSLTTVLTDCKRQIPSQTQPTSGRHAIKTECSLSYSLSLEAMSDICICRHVLVTPSCSVPIARSLITGPVRRQRNASPSRPDRVRQANPLTLLLSNISP
jgi:hypothetical protein